MFHFVKTFDGDSTGGGYQVDGCLRMQSAGLQQFHSTLHGLHHYLLGIIRLEPQFHTTFRCSTNITHGIGNTTGGEGSTCCQMLLVCDDALSHLVEQCLHFLRVLRLCRNSWNNEGHRLQVGNGDVGNNQEGGNHAACFVHPTLDIVRLYTGGNNYQNLLVIVQHILDSFQHLLYQPGLYTHTNHVSTLCCQLVAGSCRNAQCGKMVTTVTRGVGNDNFFVVVFPRLDESFYGGTTHGTSANHCYLHNVANTFFSFVINRSTSSLVRHNGGSRRRMLVPAQPVKQCSW